MAKISEVRLARLEEIHSSTRGQLSDSATIRDLLAEIRRLQKQVRSQRARLKAFAEMSKGADTPVLW